MNQTFLRLRERHPVFTYHSFQAKVVGDELHLEFSFSAGPNHSFHPRLVIPQIDHQHWESIPSSLKENLVFHLGLIELISYWKAFCSPTIKLEIGSLNSTQQQWWQNLIWEGLGEFLYRNQIRVTQPQQLIQFETVRSETAPSFSAATPLEFTLQPTVAVPLGGGKDSIVSLELLKESSHSLWLWALNPIPATERIAQLNPDLRFIAIKRTLDPSLLELNKKGYLNGHTPFSAYLAFLSVLLSVLFNSQFTAVSNEQSANEGNIEWLGRSINHQYSKSFAFERAFQEYVAHYLTPNTSYFSLLRPLHELQIAQVFSHHPRYFSAFRSCNVGQKTDSWCQHCAKCLFAFIMLAPFIDLQTLTQEIFTTNLLDDPAMIPIAESLIHPDLTKPWDCVGTREESQIAFALIIDAYHQRKQELPRVLIHVAGQLKNLAPLLASAPKVLGAWDDEHALPPQFVSLVQSARLSHD